MHSPAERPSPWYRHFWPWFIVLLMAASIAASLSTVVIAFRLGPLELPEIEPVPPARGAAPTAQWPEGFGEP